jgi:amino acid transporter
MERQRQQTEPVRARLGTWDVVSIIIGVVIGTSIFKTAPLIMKNVNSAAEGMGVWAICGILSLIGALCYAELASTYPRSGGDYVYLTRAFGPLIGFLFGWAQLAVILTSSTAMMAFVFGEYATKLYDLEPAVLAPAGLGGRVTSECVYAAVSVVFLSLLNMLGIVLGKWVQNLLTFAKVLGLVGIVVAGLGWGQAGAWTDAPVNPDASLGVAVILVLYAYGGWNDAAFVAAELRQPRHIVRALVLGTGIVTLIYLAVIAAYIQGLTFTGLRETNAVAAAVLQRPLGDVGARVMSVLVMISALGAINGLILTGSRLYASLGADHSILAMLGRWHPTLRAPIWSLLVQALITVGFVVAVGTARGQELINEWLLKARLPEIPWARYFGGFDTLFAGSAPVFWAFFLLSGLSLFKLRQIDPNISRPFRVPLYPLLPLIFCVMCGYGFYSAATYAGAVSLIGIVPLLLGLPLYCFSANRGTLAQWAGERPAV